MSLVFGVYFLTESGLRKKRRCYLLTLSNYNICKNFTSHKRIITFFLPYYKSSLLGPKTNKEIMMLLPKFLDLTMKQQKQNSDGYCQICSE